MSRFNALTHPIAITVGFWDIGVTNQVEPMSAPTLAIVRRSEQTVYHFRERRERIIGEKIPQFRQVLGEGLLGHMSPGVSTHVCPLGERALVFFLLTSVK